MLDDLQATTKQIGPKKSASAANRTFRGFLGSVDPKNQFQGPGEMASPRDQGWNVTPVKPTYKAIYRGPITPFITGSGAHLVERLIMLLTSFLA